MKPLFGGGRTSSDERNELAKLRLYVKQLEARVDSGVSSSYEEESKVENLLKVFTIFPCVFKDISLCFYDISLCFYNISLCFYNISLCFYNVSLCFYNISLRFYNISLCFGFRDWIVMLIRLFLVCAY